MGGSGGGGPSETTSTVTQNSLPEYAEPYYRDLMARVGYETATEYQPYEGQRLAYFSPMEQEAMARMGQLGTSGPSGEFQTAGQMAYMAGQGFNPGIGVGARNTYRAQAPGFDHYSANTRDSGYQAGNYDMGYTARDYQSGYTAGQLGDRGQYEGGSREVGFDPGSLADSETISQYMSPYQQAVTDINKREAARQADIRHQQLGLDAARQGGLGGYRDAILRAETERNLTQEMSDIQTRGQQSAYENAQQAFERDRAARAQLEAFEQSQFGQNQQIAQRVAELQQQGFSLDEAARQAQEQFRQGAYGMSEQARQAQEQFGQSAFGMNQQAQQIMEQLNQSQFGMNEANRQAEFQSQMAQYQAYEQARQAASQMGLTAAQINQAGQIAAAQVRLGQQQNMLAAANQMAALDSQRFGQQMQGLQGMLAMGGMERGLMQQGLDMGYQDYLRQQAFPREQLAFYSNILQGVPVTPGSTSTTYGQSPSFGQQALGAGIAGLGMAQMYGGGFGGG